MARKPKTRRSVSLRGQTLPAAQGLLRAPRPRDQRLHGGGALIAIVSTPRPSDPYQALADLAATRAPYVHDGVVTYGIDVTDHDEDSPA